MADQKKVLPFAKRLKSMPAGYRMSAKGDRGEIFLYGVIGSSWFEESISAAQFKDDLKALGDVKNIDVHINSEGGDVADGVAIYALLNNHKANIVMHVDGLAASSASLIAMAGDEIRIGENAMMMIHNPWTIAMGNAADLRKAAEILDVASGAMLETYVARTGQAKDKIKKWMDEETWFSGKEALENGFADTVVENMKVAACLSDQKIYSRYKNLPTSVLPRNAAAAAAVRGMKATIQKSKKNSV
jgi:ATP-dependent Clp protease protease subunit